MRRRTSSPSILGSFRSSRMSAGLSWSPWLSPRSMVRASAPLLATATGLRTLFFLSARMVRSRSSALSSMSRIGLLLIDCLRVKGEVDSCATIDGAFGPGPAAVAVDDAPDAGQADAGAGELVGVVEPLERLEQLADVGGGEGGPVVAHVAADGGVTDGCGRELYGGAIAAAGELPGVLEQVLQRGPDQGAIRGDPDAVLHGHPDLSAWVDRKSVV